MTDNVPDESADSDEATAATEAATTAVDPAEVAHVADLARIALTDGERERFAAQFAEVLSAFDSLDQVPDVENEADLANVLRPDETRECLDQAEALENAPETEAGHFKGPRVS